MAELKIIDLGLGPTPEKKTILVVDDEHAMHGLIFDLLQDDYRLVSAYNGVDGVKKAEQFKPSVILMDLMMPDLNGYDAVRMLRQQSETARIPVVVVTARNFDQTTVQLLKNEPNVVSFLNKPFRAKDLHSVINKALTSQS